MFCTRLELINIELRINLIDEIDLLVDALAFKRHLLLTLRSDLLRLFRGCLFILCDARR